MAEAKYVARLRREFDEKIVPAMIEKFGYKNRMEVPRLDKIVINMGVGEATQDKKKVEATKRRPDGSTYKTSRSVRVARKSGDEI
ncbi:MAG: large subunit ribosomal protein [Sphingomonadales bacterium]|nr:large subunit ribosomal protein [Sphingomonadales bacterium]